jgi:hypothetical protein
MKEKNVAVSDFAKNNTIGEQRKLLPIFSCRDALMSGDSGPRQSSSRRGFSWLANVTLGFRIACNSSVYESIHVCVCVQVRLSQRGGFAQ